MSDKSHCYLVLIGVISQIGAIVLPEFMPELDENCSKIDGRVHAVGVEPTRFI